MKEWWESGDSVTLITRLRPAAPKETYPLNSYLIKNVMVNKTERQSMYLGKKTVLEVFLPKWHEFLLADKLHRNIDPARTVMGCCFQDHGSYRLRHRSCSDMCLRVCIACSTVILV